MSTVDEVRRPPPVPLAEAAQWFVRHLCTANPFYVISAGLFLAGLYAGNVRHENGPPEMGRRAERDGKRETRRAPEPLRAS